MKKISLPFIVNSVLSFAIIFPVLTLVFGASGLKIGLAASVSLTLSVTASISLGILLTAFSKGKSPFDAHNPRMLILNACTVDEIQAYFSAYFKQKHKCTYATDKHLFVYDEKFNPIEQNETAGSDDSILPADEYYLAFYPEQISANDLATIQSLICGEYESRKLSVVSMSFSTAAFAYADQKGIELIAEKQVLAMLDEYDLLKGIEKKQTLFVRLKKLFNPIFGKKAIFYGLFIAIISPFATYGIYYAIFGGLLYWAASLTPLKKYMLRDRNDLEIV